LTDAIITRLEFYTVPMVDVEDEVRYLEDFPAPAENPSLELYSHRLRRNPRFKVFCKQYEGEVETLQIQFKQIEDHDTPDLDSMSENVRVLARSCRQMGGIISVIQNMKRMSDETYAHSLNVALICNAFSTWLGFNSVDRDIISLAGLLHDIGKIKVETEIMQKVEALSPQEMEMMKTHTTAGYAMLKDLEMDDRIKQSALLHHERSDGSGYPFGYTQSNIEYFAQVVAVADVYDAMTSPRVYRDALNPFEVIAMFENDGLHKFNIQLMLTFLEYATNTYIASRVRLSNGQVGEIIYINPHDLSRPIVNVNKQAVDLSRRRDLKIEAVIA